MLDPFVGSGALLVGSRERGAAVIGCDIAPAEIRTATAKLDAVTPIKLGGSRVPAQKG